MTGTRKFRVIVPLLFVMIAIILCDQARFLFVYPVPDTGMWFGDETWTMLTVRALARTGIACVPEALGSSLAHSNGLVNGSIWISGLIYGAPASIFSNIASPVAIGRIITFVLSIATLLFVYRLSRRLGASSIAALTAVFAFVASDAFCFSSHSARLDAITGLAVLLYLFLLVLAFERSEKSGFSERWAFLLPLIATLSLAIYVHVPTLIVLPMLYSLWSFGILRSSKKSLISLLGAVAGVAIIAVTYWLSTGGLDLLGKGYNQYYNVANSLPVLHLRSWRVQKINTIDRAIQVWEVAWPLVVALLAGIGVRIWTKAKFTPSEQFFLINTLIVFLSWTLFEGPAVFYNIHVMPVAAVCAAVLLLPLFDSIKTNFAEWAFVLILIGITVFTSSSQERRGSVGKQMVKENHNAIHSLIDPIMDNRVPPLILTDQPGLNEIAGKTGARLMTNHLLLFGEENKPLSDILRENGVNYLLLYSTYRWQSPFRQIADSLYGLVGERTGILTDQARTYDEPNLEKMDTLRLYRAK